ncbi:MAG: cytochrome c [Planctomycetota bacterium]|jgi:protein tyrosine phosphatase (PTP) superfamily phosphohydrolase (DUF442 family)
MVRRLILPLLLVSFACQGSEEAKTAPAPVSEAPPPLKGVESAYQEAGKRELAKVAPQDYPGLHNVYRLGDNIISGSEPHGEEALKRISEMGVKTIVSVDGKVPDKEVAAKFGMRYVHVPIRYSGIDEEELVRIAKTFRELQGPFYVHCFHGKHRGPAAAAVGRLVVDRVPRDQALAEMRQWCGTSKKYEGLFHVIALKEMPATATTAGYAWDFPAAHPFGGFRAAMIEITRHSDNLKMLDKRDWKPDPDHPDIDAANEAEKMLGLFQRASKLESVQKACEEYRTWMQVSVEKSGKLLEAVKAGESAAASKAFRVLGQTCNSCHANYRNN